jgi:hypothetical protein
MFRVVQIDDFLLYLILKGLRRNPEKILRSVFLGQDSTPAAITPFN